MLQFGNICMDTRFAFHQMVDCIKYKLSHNLSLVVLIIAGLYLLWRILRVEVKGAG